jgi:hypothetical protein
MCHKLGFFFNKKRCRLTNQIGKKYRTKYKKIIHILKKQIIEA